MKSELRYPRAVLVLALAVGLMSSAGCAPKPEEGAGLDQNALDGAARALVRGEDRIEAKELADLIVGGREPLALIDIRPRADFDAAHIKGSLHSDAASLVGVPGRSMLDPGARLVLVSEDGVQAAQIASLLRVAGVNAYALSGGYARWRLLMDSEGNGGAESDADVARERAKRQAVACWLEGDYVAAAGLTVKPASAPSGGFVPPLQEVAPEAPADPLGLGLGLGLGEGLAPAKPKQERKRLRVREGC